MSGGKANRTIETLEENQTLTPARGQVGGRVSTAFSMLGARIHLKGCPAADIAPVIREYSAFCSDKVHPSWTTTWDGHASPTRLTVNGMGYLGVPGKSVSPIISTKIMDHVYAAAEDFFLFHGAAAAWRDTLLVFPGQSGTGKSSLAISLAMRGWTLFSDEVIAISKDDLRVRPFPRAITVWDNSPALDEFLRSATVSAAVPRASRPRNRGQDAPETAGRMPAVQLGRKGSPESVPLVRDRMKAIIPFSSFVKPSEPLSVKAIVCLRGGRREIRKGGGQIVVTYWDERMERLARRKGIHDRLQIEKIEEFWLIRSNCMEVVEDICTSLGGLVIQRELVKNSQPVFGRAPLLEPISPSECLSALWSVFENGRSLTNCQGGVAALYLKLARLVKAVPCFWLRPGPPSPTCELLQDLAQELEKSSASCE